MSRSRLRLLERRVVDFQRGGRVVAQVQRLVALVSLVPQHPGDGHFPLAEPRDFHFACQSLEVGRVVPCPLVGREVAVVRPPLGDAQALVDKILPGVNANGEQRRLDPVIRGRVADVWHALSALALDGEHIAVELVHGEAVDLVGPVAAVDARGGNIKRRSILLVKRRQQKSVQIFPHGIFHCVPDDFLIADAPALFADAPAHDFHLETVRLHVHACRQHQHIVRHLRAVQLPPCDKCALVHPIARLFPRLAQLRVDPRFHLLRVPLAQKLGSKLVFLHDFMPAAEVGGQRIQVEAPRLGVRILRHEMAVLALALPLVFPEYLPAPFTLVQDWLCQVVLVELDLSPLERLEMAAPRARHVPLFHCTVQKLGFNPAVSLDGRRGDNDRFLVPKGRLPLLRQQQRVPLCPGALRVAVHLVGQQNLDGPHTQAHGAVRSHDGHMTAGEVFL